MDKKKIGLIYLGGRQPIITNQRQLQQWCKEFAELELVIKPKPFFIVDDISKRPNPIPQLTQAARTVINEWDRLDGFVIVFPKWNFLYHANILSLMMRSLSKPVVCTTALEDLMPATLQKFLRNDNKQNHAKYNQIILNTAVVNAAQASVQPIRGVLTVVSSELIPVDHALMIHKKHQVRTLQSQNSVYVGHFNFGLQITQKVRGRGAEYPHYFRFPTNLTQTISITTQRELPAIKIKDTTTGIIIRSLVQFTPALLEKLPTDIPCLIITPGETILLHHENAEPIKKVAPEAAAARFTWVMSSGQKPKGTLSAVIQQLRVDPDSLTIQP